jgi:hypothetical protein
MCYEALRCDHDFAGVSWSWSQDLGFDILWDDMSPRCDIVMIPRIPL